MQSVIFLIIVLLSSCYVLFLSYIAQYPIVLQRATVLPIAIMFVVILFRIRSKAGKEFLKKWGRPFFLLWGTVFVQMLVLATGGLQSPFLILIYLFMIAISFVFSFSIAVIFLALSLIIIYINLSFTQNLTTYIIQDPAFTILHIVSLLTIIPLAFLVSRQYHLRNMLFSALHAQVKTDEAILKSLQELIIVTDTKFTILSVNDAVEQTLQKSRSDLLGNTLFNVLLLRDKKGILATKETFFPHGDTTKQPKNGNTSYNLLLTTSPQREVMVRVTTTKGIADTPRQINFILSSLHTAETTESNVTNSLEKTRAKYEALSEHMLVELRRTNLTSLITQTTIMREIEKDMYYVRFLHQYATVGIISSIDVATLIKQTVAEEQEIAKAFSVALDFSIKNFGQKDIASLTVKNYPITPEQLTGPFFTVKTDVRRFEFLIKKLFDIAVFLASDQKDARMTVSITRGEHASVNLTITCSCEALNKKELPDLFIPYYGRLAQKAHLYEGSGFEGYLARNVSTMLSYPLDISYTADPSPQVIFTLQIAKSLKMPS